MADDNVNDPDDLETDDENGAENGASDVDPDLEDQKSRKKRLKLAILGVVGGILLIAIIFAQILRNPAGDTVAQPDDNTETLPTEELRLTVPALATTDPPILEFGTFEPGEKSKTLQMQVIILQNQAKVRVKDFTQNPQRALRVTKDNCSTFSSVNPNEQCSLEITWSPSGNERQVLESSELLLEISSVAEENTLEYWRPFDHRIPIQGTREKIIPPLEISLANIRFGTKTISHVGQTHTEKTALIVKHREIEIIGFDLTNNTPNGVDGVEQENDCSGSLAPKTYDIAGSCNFTVSWQSSTPGQVVDATLRVTYKELGGEEQTIEAPITGALQLPSDVPAVATLIGPDNNTVNFKKVNLDPKNKRVTLKNTGLPSVINRIEVYSDLQNVQDSFAIDSDDCITTPPTRLVHNERCVIVLRWSPVVGVPLEDSGTQLLVRYYPDGTSQNDIRLQEKELVIDLKGIPPTTYELPDDNQSSGGSGVGEISTNPAAVLSPLEEARLSYAFHRSEPVLGSKESGAIGEVQLPPPAKTRIEQLQDRLNIGKSHEQDYESIGVEPGDGVSSRPVPLTSVIAAGDVIPMTLLQSVDATATTFVTALVNSDVYSQHGRNLMIPRGSIVAGRTVPVSLPQNLAAASGVEDESEASTAAPQTAFQGKMFIEWDRIRTPQGVQWRPRGLGGQDLMGRTGVPGHYDPKEFARFLQSVTQIVGQSLVTLALGRDIWRQTTTTADGTSSVDLPNDPGPPVEQDDGDGNSSTVTVTRITPTQQARTQAIEQITQIIRQQVSAGILPTPSLFVPAGTRMILRPTEDLWLKPYIGPLATDKPEVAAPTGSGGAQGEGGESEAGTEIISTAVPTSERYQEYQDLREENQRGNQRQSNPAGVLLGIGGPDNSQVPQGQGNNRNFQSQQPSYPDIPPNPSDPASQDYYNPTPGSGGYDLNEVSPFEVYSE